MVGLIYKEIKGQLIRYIISQLVRLTDFDCLCRIASACLLRQMVVAPHLNKKLQRRGVFWLETHTDL